MLCWLLYAAYPIFSLDLCPRFPTWLGKNEGIKKWMALKNRRRSCSRFATNLGYQIGMRSSEREEKGTLKTANLGERDRNHSCPRPGPRRLHTLRPHTLRPHKHGLVLSHAVPSYQPHTTLPHKRHDPTRQHGTVNLMDSCRRSCFCGFQTRTWGKLRKN